MVHVPGATLVTVHSAKELLSTIEKGQLRRHVGETQASFQFFLTSLGFLPLFKTTFLFHLSTILPNVVGRKTAKRKVKCRLRRDLSLHPTYLQMWALWVPGEESWGRSKTGEGSQEGQMKLTPLNVIVLSAKSGCKQTIKHPIS